jgi:putative addiction module component (TIGR02574 family)
MMGEDLRMTYPELEQQLLLLPAEEREALAVRLLDSLDGNSSSPLDPEWVAEIERRYAEYRAGRTRGIPADQVFRRIRERHGWT